MENFIYNYLSDKEKNEVLESRIKNHEYSMFYAQITKAELLSSENIDESLVNDINMQILEIQNKIETLYLEKNKILL